MIMMDEVIAINTNGASLEEDLYVRTRIADSEVRLDGQSPIYILIDDDYVGPGYIYYFSHRPFTLEEGRASLCNDLEITAGELELYLQGRFDNV